MKILALIAATVALFVSSPAIAQDAQNRFRLAQSFEQAGEYDRASRLYEELLKADSLNYVYFEGLSRCYEQLKNYDAAIALSRKRLTYEPQDVSVMASLGGLYYKAGKEAAADSVWNATIALMPRSIGVYTIVASVQSDNRLFDKSIETLLRGRKEVGPPSLYAGELAALYSFLMDYSAATQEYITLLSLNQNQIDMIESRLAGFTSKKEGLAAATTTVEQAVARDNDNLTLSRLLLWLYMEGKQFDKAFVVAQKIDAGVKSNGAEMVAFAQRAYQEKAYTVAAEAYQFAIKQYPAMPQLPAAKFGYAETMEELGAAADTSAFIHSAPPLPLSETQPGYHSALALFISLAKEYPYSEISVEALYRAGLIYYKQFFDLGAAEKILDPLSTLPVARPFVPTLMATAGEINVAQGELDKAIQRYMNVEASSFSSTGQKTEARFHIAEIHYFMGKFDTASSALSQIAAMVSDDEANDALVLLHFIKENQAGYAEALKDFAYAALMERENRLSEAIPVLSSIITNDADAPLAEDAIVKRAELLEKLRQYPEALASYNKLLTDYPKSILCDKAQFGIAELFQNDFKDKEKAVHAYESLLATYPNSLYVAEARKRIRELRGDAI
ncbi:MAG TPA: tetratricopeptide repeat protein [Bacteroidota bacterium]|nr:tetratricopeptide repeat protein [Bacteroidota bacterium]